LVVLSTFLKELIQAPDILVYLKRRDLRRGD